MKTKILFFSLLMLAMGGSLFAQDLRPSAYVGKPKTVTVRGSKIQGSTGGVTTIAQQDITPTVNATTYIYVDLSGTPVIGTSTSGFPTSNYFPICTVITDINGIITSFTDNRPDAFMAAGGGGGAVSSVFTRTGAVVATANDYSVAQLSGLPVTAAQGGTGVASPTIHALLAAQGPSAMNVVCTPPAANGDYNVVYHITGAAAVDPTCPQVGLGGAAGLTGAATTYTVLFSDNGTILTHDKAASGAINVTLNTATTLGNANFAFRWSNHSAQTDTITPTTWTIQSNASAGGATITIASGVTCLIKVDPNLATQWVADCTSLGGAGSGASGLVTILTKTANYTTASGDFSAAASPPTEVIYAVTTATTVTHTLPSTVTTSGAYQIVKNSCTSTFGLYVAPANALTLDGDTTNMFLPPCNQLTITSDGTNWRSSLWENRQANLGTYFPLNALDRFGFNAPSGANVSQVYTFQLEKPVKISKITFLYTVGAAASTGDYGVYDQGGNLVTHTGSQSTAVATNQNVQAAASPVVTLAPGVYTIAMCDSSVTPTFAQATVSGFVNGMANFGTSTFGSGQGATACTAGVLPATLGAVTYNNTQAGAVLMVVTP